MVRQITPQEFLAQRAGGAEVTLLDVREAWEIEHAPVPAALIHIPMGEIPDRLAELDPQKTTAVICRSGGRSMEVAKFLEARGFSSVANVSGGILAWSRDLDPTIPQY